MLTFYRYIRPVRFDSKRIELQTYLRGGVCLRFQEHSDRTLWFTHARCRHDELFAKDIARKIVDQRAQSADLLIINEMRFVHNGSSSLINSVIHFCATWDPVPYPPIVSYAKNEMRELGFAITEIMNCNLQEEQKMNDWVTIQTAANFQNDYARLSR